MKNIQKVWAELSASKKPLKTNLSSKKIDEVGKELNDHVKEFQKHEATLDNALKTALEASYEMAGVVAKVHGGEWQKKWETIYDQMYYMFEEIGMFWIDSEMHDTMQSQMNRKENLLERVNKIGDRASEASKTINKIY